jgi:spore germination protein GerM
MTRGLLALVIAALLVAGALAWLLFVTLPGRVAEQGPDATADAPAPAAAAGRKITARIFYVSDDGSSLTGAEREVPFAESTAEQAKAIIEAQLAPAADPFVSAIPPGTKLRALFVTPAGEAFVDVSPELRARHPGGSLTELLTIYSLVDALTVNLPAVTAVQVLIDGKEVDTLAGHVDLRQPLVKNLSWVQ